MRWMNDIMEWRCALCCKARRCKQCSVLITPSYERKRCRRIVIFNKASNPNSSTIIRRVHLHSVPGGGSISGASQPLNPKIGAELLIPDLHVRFLTSSSIGWNRSHISAGWYVVDVCITKSVLALHTCGLAGQCVLCAVVALAQILVISLPMVLLQWDVSRTKIQRMTDYSAIFCLMR